MDPDQPPNPVAPPSPGFEGALDQLERAVAELEGGDLGLDAALAKYEEGVRLLSSCHGLLAGVERRVAVVTGVDAAGVPETVPFDGAPPAARETPSKLPPRVIEPRNEADDDLPF